MTNTESKIETKPTMTVEQIARVCHAANIEVQISNGEVVSPRWAWLDESIRESAIVGVEEAMMGAGPEELHESWMENRLVAGWTLGDVKDSVAKTHPCLVPYSELPKLQRLKDAVFLNTVNIFKDDFNIVK